MIESLTPYARRLLVKYRILAMKGEIEVSLKELKELLNSNEINLELLEQLSILMLYAEILYLDGREKESFVLFEEEIMPVLDSISQDDQNIKMTVLDNYYEVAIDQLKPGSLAEYYQHSDLKKLSDIKFLEPESLIAAHERADEGKLYDAFPVFWRQIPGSYYLGNWRAFRLATNRFAKECLKLNLLDKAAFYSILAMNQKIAEEIGNRLLELKDKQLIEKTVERIVNYSHLLKHSNVVFKIIDCITDAIPNDQVEVVFQWLYKRCKPGFRVSNNSVD